MSCNVLKNRELWPKFVISRTPGDGNCLLHSLFAGLEIEDTKDELIKTKIRIAERCRHIFTTADRTSDEYLNILHTMYMDDGEDNNFDHEISLEKLNRQLHEFVTMPAKLPYTYMTPIIAQLFETDLHIYVSTHLEPTIHWGGRGNRPPIYLYHSDHNSHVEGTNNPKHFDLLIPRENNELKFMEALNTEINYLGRTLPQIEINRVNIRVIAEAKEYYNFAIDYLEELCNTIPISPESDRIYRNTIMVAKEQLKSIIIEVSRPNTAGPARPASEAKVARPASEAKVQPASVDRVPRPARPITATPARPSSATPAGPITARPARPITARPARPITATPARPASVATEWNCSQCTYLNQKNRTLCEICNNKKMMLKYLKYKRKYILLRKKRNN
jgi:hypothetical protein